MAGCDGITRAARVCRRGGTVAVELVDGTTRHYCAQHAAGRGVMKMLLPFPWERKTEGTVGA